MTCVVIDDYRSIFDKVKNDEEKTEISSSVFMKEYEKMLDDGHFPFELPYTLYFKSSDPELCSVGVTFEKHGFISEYGAHGLLSTYLLEGKTTSYRFPVFEAERKCRIAPNDLHVVTPEGFKSFRASMFLVSHYICNFDTYYEKIDRAERKRIANSSGGKVKHTDLIVRLLDRREGSSKAKGRETGGVRYHLCRGHYKNHLGKQRIWIKPHWKGNKELGVVHKEYRV